MDSIMDEDEVFVPIKNPFTENNTENFPSLTQFLDATIEHDQSMDEEEATKSHISLNLSIDTLAKVKPADISNVEVFLAQKDVEDEIEEGHQERREIEDTEYFLNRSVLLLREEELSPQSRLGTRTVLYDESREKQIQTALSIDPTHSIQYRRYHEEEVDGVIQIFDSSMSLRDDEDTIQTPKRKGDNHLAPHNDIMFFSPIPIKGGAPQIMMTPNHFMSPIISNNRNMMHTPQFTSPILKTTKNTVIDTPQFRFDLDHASPLTPEKSTVEYNSALKKVAKKLTFTSKNVGEQCQSSDEELEEKQLPVYDAIKRGAVTMSRGQFADLEGNVGINLTASETDKQNGRTSSFKKTVTFAHLSPDSSLVSYHCGNCMSDVSFYSTTSAAHNNSQECHICRSKRISLSVSSVQSTFDSSLHSTPSIHHNQSYMRYSLPMRATLGSPYSKPLSPSNYEYLKKRYLNF
ncbi:cc2d1b [Acrasis kona]|uniref:Cc2d1b n=1 Tax=Acrasis kona TaxID=1008807 RepID=A0AAW2YSQ0_9EUKA